MVRVSAVHDNTCPPPFFCFCFGFIESHRRLDCVCCICNAKQQANAHANVQACQIGELAEGLDTPSELVTVEVPDRERSVRIKVNNVQLGEFAEGVHFQQFF